MAGDEGAEVSVHEWTVALVAHLAGELYLAAREPEREWMSRPRMDRAMGQSDTAWWLKRKQARPRREARAGMVVSGAAS